MQYFRNEVVVPVAEATSPERCAAVCDRASYCVVSSDSDLLFDFFPVSEHAASSAREIELTFLVAR